MFKFILIIFFTSLPIFNLLGQDEVEKTIRAYVFLSDECPMCQGYAPVLNQLSTDFGTKGVEIIGVFPNYYVSDSAIMAFKKEYFIAFKTVRDTDFVLTNRFQASITPQIFIENQEGVLVYNGQIDNAYFRAGKRRGTTSAHYVREAIKALLKNEIPKIAETKAVGCVIVRE